MTVLAPPPPSPPTGTSLPAVPFEATSNGFWAFVRYCQQNWDYERDNPGELVQSPGVTFRRMNGDCDDFATMIAGYAQDYWPYDSFVAHLESYDSGHAVAFIRCNVSVMESYYDGCGPFPYWRLNDGSTYMPIDQARCHGWHWRNYGGIYTFEWYKEWTWWVGRARSARATLFEDQIHLGTNESGGS